MNKKFKIIIFSGVFVMLLICGAALFMRIAYPSGAFESESARSRLCLRLALEIRGDIYRCSTSALHVPDSVTKKIDEAGTLLHSIRRSSYADSIKGLPVYSVFSSCMNDGAEVLNTYKTVIERYNGLGGVNIKPFDTAILNKIEKLSDSYIKSSEIFFREGALTAQAQMKNTIVVSGILIVGTWFLGLFVTWVLVNTLYRLFIIRAEKKRVIIRLGPKQSVVPQDNDTCSAAAHISTINSAVKMAAHESEISSAGVSEYSTRVSDASGAAAEYGYGGSVISGSNFMSGSSAETAGFSGAKTSVIHSADAHVQSKSVNGTPRLDSMSSIHQSKDTEKILELEKEVRFLERSYNELNRTHQDLKEAYELLEQKHAEAVSITKKSDDNVKMMLNTVQETAQVHINDTHTVQELVEAFQAGQQLFRENHGQMQYIVQNVSKIREMSEMSETIAEQIKMLGMNAAIEAAHAGDAGKGFGVVAEELSRLGDAALESSHDIGGTITHIIKTITKIGSTGDDLDKAFDRLNGQTVQIYDSLTAFSSEMDKTIQNAQDALANI